jgi:hypothetical protein
MNRLRDKLEQLKNPGARRSRRPIWRPNQDGEECMIRLIQYPYGEDPFVELWFHYGVGQGPGANFLCPRLNHGKACPVCEFASSLIKSDDEQDKALAKKMFAKQRVHAIVVDRADSTNTPKFWGFGKQVYQTLLETLVDEDYGNYLDPYEGLDVKVKYQKAQGQAYPSTTVKFARKETPLADSDAEVQQILSKIPKADDVFESVTRSQIEEQLNSWLDFGKTEEEVEEASREETKGGNTAVTNTKAVEETVGGNSVEDIDAAFEQALG